MANKIPKLFYRLKEIMDKFHNVRCFQNTEKRWMYSYECGYCKKPIKKRIMSNIPQTDKGPSCSKCYQIYFHNTMDKLIFNQKDQWARIAKMYDRMVEGFEQRRNTL